MSTACLLTLALCATPDVLTVETLPGPGVDFTDLQLAIDAAQDGDTLLIGGGDYARVPATELEFRIDGKGLELVERAGESVSLNSGLVIANLAPDQTVGVRGIDVRVPAVFVFFDARKQVSVENCAGLCWLEDMLVAEQAPSGFGVGSSSLFVTDSACLVGSRLELEGDGTNLIVGLSIGGSAIGAVDSNLFLYDVEATSPEPESGNIQTLRARGSTIIAQGGRIIGAPGLPGSASPFIQCGTGGRAAMLLDPDVELFAYGTAIRGGRPGSPDPCGSAEEGPVKIGLGLLEQTPTVQRSLDVPALWTAGAPFDATFSGVPGDLTLVAARVAATPLHVPAFAGSQLLPTAPPVFLGALPAGGNLTLTFTGPSLPPGALARGLVVQAAMVDAGGSVVLSNGTRPTVLAPGL